MFAWMFRRMLQAFTGLGFTPGHSVCGVPDLTGRVTATVGLALPVVARAVMQPRVTATVGLAVCEE